MFSERISQSFNLGLEVLTGCAYSCLGCTVNKNLAPFEIPEEDAKALLSMLDDLVSEDFRLLELKIGPTDITSADNGFAVLRDPTVRAIASRYKVITINMSMLTDKGLPELAALLDDMADGKYVNVGIPFTLKNIANEKYMGIVKERLVYFRSLLKKAKFTRIYATINMEESNFQQLDDEAYTRLRNYDFGEGFTKVIEYPFVMLREGVNNLIATSKLRRDIKTFAEFSKTKVNTHEFIPLIPGHREGYEYTYRTGDLYSTVVLIENLTVFHDDFKLDKPWTAQRIISDRVEMYENNLMKYSQHPECGECCFLDNCARCDVPRLMDAVGADTCLMDMKNQIQYYHHEDN